MQNGMQLFKFYLDKIEALLEQAANDLNPALFLYSNDARTPLFMLESLSRLYGTMHHKKKFKKLKVYFKALEDGIGAVDYYDSFAKAFQQHPAIPVYIREYMQAQTREKLQHVNDILVMKNWLGEDADRIKKIRKSLKKVEWLQPKDEIKAIKAFYEDAIDDIKSFVKKHGSPFTAMEDGVHEFRRDIRWLSIYPQALQGMVQLNESAAPGPELQKYLVPEIVNSKYNVMPAAGKKEWLLIMEKNHFYALSWMIAETGKIKDLGLEYFAIAEALQQLENMSSEEAMQKTFQLLNVEHNKMDQLLAYASIITGSFIKEKNLEQLVLGRARRKEAQAE